MHQTKIISVKIYSLFLLFAIINCTEDSHVVNNPLNNNIRNIASVSSTPIQNGMYPFIPDLWEGVWFTRGSSNGTWFPSVNNGIGSFAADDYSWGIINTKDNFQTGDCIEFKICPFLNSGGVWTDAATIGFGDQVQPYLGNLFGVELYQNTIAFYECNPQTPSNYFTIGSYQIGEWIKIKIELRQEKSIKITITHLASKTATDTTITYTVTPSILRFIIATSGSEVGHGFDVDSVRNVPNYRLPFEGTKAISAGPDDAGHNGSKYQENHEAIDVVSCDPNHLRFRVVASKKGKVVAKKFANGKSNLGNHIVIEHADGSSTLYAHLSSFQPNISLGSDVAKGAPIGYAGNSGNGKKAMGIHLHFQIRDKNGTPDPIIRALPGLSWVTGDPNNTANVNRTACSICTQNCVTWKNKWDGIGVVP
jgi:hypothetical protein